MSSINFFSYIDFKVHFIKPKTEFLDFSFSFHKTAYKTRKISELLLALLVCVRKLQERGSWRKAISQQSHSLSFTGLLSAKAFCTQVCVYNVIDLIVLVHPKTKLTSAIFKMLN